MVNSITDFENSIQLSRLFWIFSSRLLKKEVRWRKPAWYGDCLTSFSCRGTDGAGRKKVTSSLSAQIHRIQAHESL